jgi:hypothetical protein
VDQKQGDSNSGPSLEQSKIGNPKSERDDEFLGSVVVSPYECGTAVVLKTLEQEAAYRERLAAG